MASRAVAALSPSSKPSTISTGCAEHAAGGVDRVGGGGDGVDQRLADRRPLARLRQQQPDAQHAVVDARRRRSSWWRCVAEASSATWRRRRRTPRDDGSASDDRGRPRRTGGERALHHDRAAADPLPFTDGSTRRRPSPRRDAAHRRRRSLGGRELCRALSDATDELLVGLFAGGRRPASRPPPQGRRSPSSPSAATAAGSWPRRATSTSCSCYDGKPGGIDELAKELWYPLWDAGLKLGHAVRSLDDQLALAGDDLDTATSLLSARPLAGDDELAPAWSPRAGPLAAQRPALARRPALEGHRAPHAGRRRRLPARARPQGRPRRAARRADAVVGGRRRPARPGRRPRRARPLLRHAGRRPRRAAPRRRAGPATCCGSRTRTPWPRASAPASADGLMADVAAAARTHRLDRRRGVAARLPPPARPRGARRRRARRRRPRGRADRRAPTRRPTR